MRQRFLRLGAVALASRRWWRCARSADDVLKAALKMQPWFAPNVDGYFLTEDVATTFAAGRQARVPLLAGWNADEIRAGIVLGRQKPTAKSFTDDVRKRFGTHADAILKVYPASLHASPALRYTARSGCRSPHQRSRCLLQGSSPMKVMPTPSISRTPATS